MTRSAFERLVERALRTLPRRFREKVENVAVLVEDWPAADLLADMGIVPPDTLYGLYQGVDLRQRATFYGNCLPDTITIYQGPIEEDCATAAEMAQLVRETVMHELGHYFGLDDDELRQIEESED